MIREAVITTVSSAGEVHITPLGYRVRDGLVVLAPFVPSRTLENLRLTPRAVLNFVDDVRVIAGCLTGRRTWPIEASTKAGVPRLRAALAHWELEVSEVREHCERPEFHCRVAEEAMHRPFLGFNRAQAAVVELAILVSRLDWLVPSKVASDLAYLQTAVDKTAGDDEREAWAWLVAAVRTHPRHAIVASVTGT
ncbi:MAG: DUF447 family protein [Gammaproteobacteria bacterium]|nr:DUF447 family protein [Gammaproteobacteria bacterium]